MRPRDKFDILPALMAHIAMYQAGIVVADISGEPGFPARYHAVPRVTVTDPEVGAVGLPQAQALAQGLRVRRADAVGTRGWRHGSGSAVGTHGS